MEDHHCLNLVRTSWIVENPFLGTQRYERYGLFSDNRTYLQIMDAGFERDSNRHWIALFPFQDNRPRLPDNRKQAVRRATSLDRGLQLNGVKHEHIKF